MRPLFLTGWRGSGKDHLARALRDEVPWVWEVWSHGPAFESDKRVRLAFADAIKARVAGERGVSVAEIEADKPRYRADLIAAGAAMRAADADGLVRAMANALACTDAAVVTDMRLPAELRLAYTVGAATGRVFRACVAAPPAGEMTEHALDDEETDFLFVPYGEFPKAILVFPQYKSWQRVSGQ